MQALPLQNYHHIPIICGPTASGKSRMAMEVCQRTGGELVSLDSMQIYQYLDIGTAKPSLEEQKEIPHHMIDILPPDVSFSVADFSEKVLEVIKSILQRDKLPVLAGGTGQYVQSLVLGIQYNSEESPEKNRDIKKNLEQELLEQGAVALHEQLRHIDPIAAEKIHPNNTKRLLRALEIFRSTGKTMTEQNQASLEKGPAYPYKVFYIDRSREELYLRINDRVDQMIDQGLVEEVIRVQEKGLRENKTASQAIGYKELFSYIDGNGTLEDAVNLIKQRTRNYAKRQVTWYTHMSDIIPISAAETDKILQEISF